jgi:rare lipoprotein A
MDRTVVVRASVLGFLILLLAASSAYVRRANPPDPPSASTPPFQTGRASWYGPGFHGQEAASGEVFDQHQLTAAHRTLPFGTKVRVTNLKNGRSVVVTINDRGPYTRAIIDLSRAAAQELGELGEGLFRVRLDIVEYPPEDSPDSEDSGS